MQRLLFGISGLPVTSTKKLNYPDAIDFLKGYGLDAMELPFVRSVNVTDRNKDAILESKSRNDFYLSAHGSYFLNLNGRTQELQDESLARIVEASEALAKVQGRSLVFHPGFYLESTPEQTYAQIRDNLSRLPANGVDYRLETTGKGTQFGSVAELVAICREVGTCKLCVDFSHVHARGVGCLKNYEDFAAILALIEDQLGREALDDLHIHMAGIEYGAKGEKKHLPFQQSDFNYAACLKALKDFRVKGCLICESPLLEEDALLLKNTYEKLP